MRWQPIETAPRDGTPILAFRPAPGRKGSWEEHRTHWGKASHVPVYGWVWGKDVEDLDTWHPTYWKPLKNRKETK